MKENFFYKTSKTWKKTVLIDACTASKQYGIGKIDLSITVHLKYSIV